MFDSDFITHGAGLKRKAKIQNNFSKRFKLGFNIKWCFNYILLINLFIL